MKRTMFFERWDRWWLRTGPPHAQAIARMGFGLFLLIGLGRDLPHVTMLYSTQGVPLPLYPMTIPTPVLAHVLYGVLLLAALGLTLGCALRTSCVLVLTLGLYFWNVNLHLFPATIHRVSFILLLVFLVSGADRTMSLRMRRRQGSWFAWEPVSILAQRLIAIQLTATYLGSAIQKLWLPMWQGGEILRVSFMSRWATPLAFGIAKLPLSDRVYDFMTEVVKFVEFLLPFGFWIRKARPYAFLVGALFHVAVGALLSIWAFLVLLPLYPCFLPPEDVERGVERLRRAFPGGRK